MIFRSVLALFFMLFTFSVEAVSFDCSRAASFAEKEICRDGYLSGLDDILSKLYQEARGVAGDPIALRAAQRAWVASRDVCSVQKCVDESMSGRITELGHFISDEKHRASIAIWEAEQARLQMVEAQRQQAQEAERLRRESENLARINTVALAQQQESAARSSEARPVSSPLYSVVSQAASTGRQVQPVIAPAAHKGLWERFVDGPAWKYAAIAMLCVLGAAVALHRSGELTVYVNFTDALVTNALPAGGLLAWLLLSWLELPSPLPELVGMLAVLLAMAFAMFMAFVANDAIWKIALSFVAKLMLVSLFYVLMALLIVSLLPTKYKDETRAQAAARNRRGDRATKVQIAGLAVGYTFLSRWLCRDGEFTTVPECFTNYTNREEA